LFARPLGGSCPSSRSFAPDATSRQRPCASLILRRHQAGQRTSTSDRSINARHTTKSPGKVVRDSGWLPLCHLCLPAVAGRSAGRPISESDGDLREIGAYWRLRNWLNPQPLATSRITATEACCQSAMARMLPRSRCLDSKCHRALLPRVTGTGVPSKRSTRNMRVEPFGEPAYTDERHGEHNRTTGAYSA
jgi:hypothetical protein